MGTALTAMRKRFDRTGSVSAADVAALLAIAEAYAKNQHALTCKGCRLTFDAARPMLRPAAELRSVGRAGAASI